MLYDVAEVTTASKGYKNDTNKQTDPVRRDPHSRPMKVTVFAYVEVAEMAWEVVGAKKLN